MRSKIRVVLLATMKKEVADIAWLQLGFSLPAYRGLCPQPRYEVLASSMYIFVCMYVCMYR